MNSPLTHRSHRRHGFVLLTTIAVMGIIMITMATLMTLTRLQIARSFRAAQDAQLRQLLLAGTIAAQSQIDASADLTDAPAFPLPPGVAKQSATLRIQWLPASNTQHRTTRITATLPGQSLTETAGFSLENNYWVLTSAQLD